MKYLFALFLLASCGPDVKKPVMAMMCIEGHYYYLFNYHGSYSLAGRLTEKGKPYLCDANKTQKEVILNRN